jgi:hypothetical protein
MLDTEPNVDMALNNQKRIILECFVSAKEEAGRSDIIP